MRIRPGLGIHDLAVMLEPFHLRHCILRHIVAASREETPAMQHRMLKPYMDELRDEVQHVLLVVFEVPMGP